MPGLVITSNISATEGAQRGLGLSPAVAAYQPGSARVIALCTGQVARHTTLCSKMQERYALSWHADWKLLAHPLHNVWALANEPPPGESGGGGGGGSSSSSGGTRSAPDAAPDASASTSVEGEDDDELDEFVREVEAAMLAGDGDGDGDPAGGGDGSAAGEEWKQEGRVPLAELRKYLMDDRF